jgi:hypothetical protein
LAQLLFDPVFPLERNGRVPHATEQRLFSSNQAQPCAPQPRETYWFKRSVLNLWLPQAIAIPNTNDKATTPRAFTTRA